MSRSAGDGVRLVRIDDLWRCLANAFERLRLTPEDADGMAGLLLDSELRGHPDHGAAALGILTTLYREGKLNPRPRVCVLNETDGTVLLDGVAVCALAGAVPCVPRLLVAATGRNCRTVEQMRLANALCRLVEVATSAFPRVPTRP